MGAPTSQQGRAGAAAPVAARPPRIGCVSFLNSKPLIHGLTGRADLSVAFDVPSRLLADLEAGAVDVALCPIIDYQRSRTPLVIVPVGGIGCEGPTLTVRLFSRTPLPALREVHADTDSHTSVALLRVLLAERLGLRPAIVDFKPLPGAPAALEAAPPAVLLIGDKVVTRRPDPAAYAYEWDLGQVWHEWTGLPFVFAVWMAREGADLGGLPGLLDQTRCANAGRIDAIVAQYAPAVGWPADLARDYLGRLLRYAIGPRELAAVERFFALARRHGLAQDLRPARLYPAAVASGRP